MNHALMRDSDSYSGFVLFVMSGMSLARWSRIGERVLLRTS